MEDHESLDLESKMSDDNILTSSLKKMFSDYGKHKKEYITLFIVTAVVVHFAIALFYQNFSGVLGGGSTIVLSELFIPMLFVNPGMFVAEVLIWFVAVLLIVQMRGVYDKPYTYDERRGVYVMNDQTGKPDEGGTGVGGNAHFMDDEEEDDNFFMSKTLDDFPYQILGINKRKMFCAKIPSKRFTNDNMSIFGCPGCGKSACIVLPAIYQAIRGGRSFVVTDSKGSVYRESAYFAEKAGFETKIINLKPKELFASDGVNYMKAIHTSMDANTMAEVIMKNTNEGRKEDYWYDAAKNLLAALIGYVAFDDNILPKNRHLGTVYNMLIEKSAEELTEIFTSLKPTHPSYAYGMIFSNTPDSPKQSAYSGLAIRLNLLSQHAVQDFVSHDEVDFRAPMSHPCAYYVVISDTDTSTRFLASLFFSLIFNELYDEADGRYAGKPPVAVDFILDEFKATGSINRFEQLCSTSRSRKINIQFIMQDLQQLEAMYPDEWRTIINDCTTSVFIKAREAETLKYFSDMYGKQTILVKNKKYDENVRTIFKTHAGYGVSESFKERSLMTTDDLVYKLTNDELIINTEGGHTSILEKFQYWNHPFYKILVDEAHDGARPKYMSAKDHVPAWRQEIIDKTGSDPCAADAAMAPKDDIDEELENGKRQHAEEEQNREDDVQEESVRERNDKPSGAAAHKPNEKKGGGARRQKGHSRLESNNF